MKIKINWGTAIVIAIALFMAFILSFVYKVTFIDKYNHHLVSKDYYKDELLYQQEIDKLENAASLNQNISLIKTAKGLLISFPDEFVNDSISGYVYLQRLSDIKLDINEELKVIDNVHLITSDKLVNGKYAVKVEWKRGGEVYLLKENYIY